MKSIRAPVAGAKDLALGVAVIALENSEVARGSDAAAIGQARGDGAGRPGTRFGLTEAPRRDLMATPTQGHPLSPSEALAQMGRREERPGTGSAIRIAAQDPLGIGPRIRKLAEALADE